VTSRLLGLAIDALEAAALEDFWFSLLGDEPGLVLRFPATDLAKTGPNQAHFDLTSGSLEEQQATVARALELGARHLDVGQLPEEQHVVLADPEGNEFCVIEPGNTFLEGTGRIGALSCDGTQEVGYFWSAALGWPLVWDQDEETAIQSPSGGTKISWGGPPLRARTGTNRFRLDLDADGDPTAEIDRLIALGASRIDPGQRDVERVVLADPDGNEFCVYPTATR